MIKFEYYDAKELAEVDYDALREQEVCVDDIDYFLFCECDIEQVDWLVEAEHFSIEYAPIDYNVEKLLSGCCSNKWFKIKDFQGRTGVLGVAYHA